MDETLKNSLYKLMYFSNEYQFYNKHEYKEYYDFIKNLESNFDKIDDIELQYILKNWIYYNNVYKTISINGFHVRLNDKLFINIINLIQIREKTKYNINIKNMSLHIYYDNRYDNINMEQLKKISTIKEYFDNIYIHLYNNQWFINDLYEYCRNNDFELVYELENVEQIINNKESCHIFITDNNINSLENIIEKCSKTDIKRLYITPHLKESKNRNIYRNKINKLLETYNTNKFIIIFDEYIIGQQIGININDKIYLKSGNEDILFLNENIDKILEEMKIFLIEQNYIDTKCINCDEVILCLLGISEKYCEVKIL